MVEYVSPKEISDYLKEIKKQGKEEEYREYIKSLVLDFQRQYIEKLTPYYERVLKVKENKEIKAEEEKDDILFIMKFRNK